MPNNAGQFKQMLFRTAGLSQSVVDAAWPEWWSDAAEGSASAQAELRFSVARKLGLDARTLLGDSEPRFIWDDSAKYKNFTGDARTEGPAITAFGTSVGRILCSGTAGVDFSLRGMSAEALRQMTLSNRPFVGLVDLLSIVWACGVPVVHLRVYPLSVKRMCAMSVSVGSRFAILLAKDAMYPPSSIFHLAHEIGHIALGHVAPGSAVIDMDGPEERGHSSDSEEREADRFALELLTGSPDFELVKVGRGDGATALANAALSSAEQNGIEPGVLALCYGHATGDWSTANGALKQIYNAPKPVWREINAIANEFLDWDELGDDNGAFVRAIMGGEIG